MAQASACGLLLEAAKAPQAEARATGTLSWMWPIFTAWNIPRAWKNQNRA